MCIKSGRRKGGVRGWQGGIPSANWQKVKSLIVRNFGQDVMSTLATGSKGHL